MARHGQKGSNVERHHEEMDLSTTEGTNELISYLVVRFVLVMLAVMAAESLVVWFEGRCLLPLLRGMARGINVSIPKDASSLGALFRWFGLLVGSIVRGNYLQTLGLARGSLLVLLTLLMLAMLVLAPLYGALMYARMVVRRVRALQERRERELAQIDQQRSQFMTDIAHDLRTPLMAISGMAHAISDGVVRDDAQRDEYLQSICDKTDKLSGLVSSVFEYTKLGSGAYALDRTTVDLPQLLLREAAVAYEDIEAAGMHLSVDVSEEPCPVFADDVQLGRVVANLLVNAVRHNEAGTEIALLLVREAGVAYVVVADTGTPIAEDPATLFQPFTRGDAARSSAGGSGLGLSICKRIADLHGYDLTLAQPYGRFAKAFALRCVVVG
jgi:signal transduction histidine kinase